MTVSKITDEQKEQLLRVTPSKDWTMEYRPCQVTLKNGDTLDNVFIQDEETYLEVWGVMPDADSGKRFVLIEDILDIRESPNRLRPELANKIYKAGESGMGYCLYKLILDNGQTIDVCTGNAVDFVSLPNGLTAKNIKDVVPHRASRKNIVNGPNYYWCLFKGPIPKTYLDSKNEDEITATNISIADSGVDGKVMSFWNSIKKWFGLTNKTK